MISKGRSMFTPEKDNRIRIMNDRINFVEKHFGELCSAFGAYTRKLGRYRDKHDELAKAFQMYSEEEPFNKGTAVALDSLTKAITFLADYMDMEVQRLESKVINQLTPYENYCRSTRESLKSAILIRDKELAREKQLMEIRSKFTANTSAADSELLKVKVEVNRTNKDVENVMENFEKRKLKDIKTILLDFIAIEMKQHTKALEILTATYQDVDDIDEKKDFQEFKRALKSKLNTFSKTSRRARSQSLESLGIPRPLHSKKLGLSRSHRNLARAAAGKESVESENSEADDDDDDDDDDEEERLPPPDQDSASETSEEEDSTLDDGCPGPRSKPGKLLAFQRVPTFKTFCEGVEYSAQERRDMDALKPPPHTSHAVQINSVNGIPKRR
ncbi:protein FAM92A-A [Hermetia illucens]|uniref:protein FAM92A-A n=1 Tax=Hermetia illucens TaxID=343691 RepID=UPI0018CC31B1|nr:protein FAM92A-A [Hermetia illucens]